jgi:hypothetical protein
MAQNKPLPSVPNERPPFMTPPFANVELASRGSSRQQSPPSHPQIRVVSHESSEESLGEHDQEDDRLTSRQQAPSDVDVPPPNVDGPSGHHRSASNGIDRRSEDVQIVLHQDMYEHTPEAASFSDEKEVVVPDEKEVLVHSPPLTGKDSAYSSVSGTSYASPTSVHPRSASAQSSLHPRAQFGLFPSSVPSTPKHSTMSGRYGAVSPALTARRAPEPAPPFAPLRASTSLDNHLPSSRNRLLKKSSLSSLKRLFSKKKHSSVDTIVE